MFDFLISLASILLFVSVLGYSLTVLKEKYYLKNNIILIDNKHISQDEIDDMDMQEFFLDGTRLKAGDEITVVTKTKEKFRGVVLGAVQKEQSIKLVTHANEIIKLKIETIKQFRIMSKYGKFFS